MSGATFTILRKTDTNTEEAETKPGESVVCRTGDTRTPHG